MTRILLADDAVLLREAIAAGLAAAGFEVVGEAADVEGLLRERLRFTASRREWSATPLETTSTSVSDISI
jgi:hypothetical protein